MCQCKKHIRTKILITDDVFINKNVLCLCDCRTQDIKGLVYMVNNKNVKNDAEQGMIIHRNTVKPVLCDLPGEH